jgi:hypothetical protein
MYWLVSGASIQTKRTVVLFAPLGLLTRIVLPSPTESTFNSATATVVVMLLNAIAVVAGLQWEHLAESSLWKRGNTSTHPSVCLNSNDVFFTKASTLAKAPCPPANYTIDAPGSGDFWRRQRLSPH